MATGTISTTITSPLTLSYAETTITNTGGVVVTPSGTATVAAAIYNYGVARTLINYGSVINKQTGPISYGITGNTGIILNKPGGVISANVYGVQLTGYVGDFRTGHGTLLAQPTVINGGTITDADSFSGSGIGGGIDSYILNRHSGTISGAISAITFGGYPRAGSVINSGTVVNDGTIIGHSGIASVEFMKGVSGTVANTGLITTTPTGGSYEGNYGVVLTQGGVITNTGTIAGTYEGLYFRLGGTVLAGSVTVTNAGTIAGGTAAIKFQSKQTNLLIVDPGAVFIGNVVGGASATSTLELAAGGPGTISGFGSKYTNFGTLTFDPSANWLVSGNSAGFASAVINGFNSNDTIDITNFTATSYTIVSGNQALVLTNSVNAHETLSFGAPVSNLHVTSGAFGTDITTVCFCAGTLIDTPIGAVPVELLNIGDSVLTASGAVRTVRWIGHRHLGLTVHPNPQRAEPIRIAADALADGVPRRDLFLSPDHAVLVDGVLVPVKLLVNDGSVQRDTGRSAVSYYHIELDQHDVVLAENLAAESYFDTGNRGFFANADVPLVLHPDFTKGQARREAESCAPFATDAATIEPMWRKLALRAVQLGLLQPRELETTDDPGLCVVADGRRIQPISAGQKRYLFLLPRSHGMVRLQSRSAVPNEAAPWMEDHRRLGVMLRRLTLRSGEQVSPIPLDDPALGDGWWDPEWHTPTTLRRWTNGDAMIRIPCAGEDPFGLEIELAGTLAYPLRDVGGGEERRHCEYRASRRAYGAALGSRLRGNAKFW